MKMLTYPFKAFLSILLSIVAFLLCGVIALFVQPNGYLPTWLAWFQTPDNPATGDPNWNKGVISWLNTSEWIARNPAQGFDSAYHAIVSYDDPCTLTTDRYGGRWYRCNGYIEYAQSIPVGSRFMLLSFGYRLRNIYERYPHPTQGQLIAWPVRFNVKAT